MRILHLSDLHAAGPEDLDQSRIVSALIEDLLQQDAERQVDLIVFSGDLAFDGSAEGLRAGQELLLDPLREALPNRPLVVVPGNHDVNRERIDGLLEAGLRETLATREATNRLVADEPEISRARDRLHDWDEFHAALYAADEPEQLHPLAYVHRHEVDD